MKNLVLTAFAATSLFLFSCQKDKSLELNGTPPPAVGSLLTKTVAKIGQDSSSVLYQYDPQKRLIASVTTGSFLGSSFESRKVVTRNAAGIIQNMKVITDGGTDMDTVVYQVNYDIAKARYTSLVNKQMINGIEFLDSTAFVYDAGGKLIKEEFFIDNGTYGGYADFSKIEYAYDANGNVIKATGYDYDDQAGVHNISYEDVYEYDVKVNPIKLGTEAILLSDVSLTGKNNMIKLTSKDHNNASNNDVTTVEYVYNTDNRPKTAKITSQSLGVQVPVTYTYE